MRETLEEKLSRMTRYERELWRAGFQLAGIDEVGRGSLAGPLAAACVSLPMDGLIMGVDDSKKCSPKLREALYGELVGRASYVKTAWVSPADIDEVNVLNATRRAMAEAADGLAGAMFLVDAVEGLPLKGDVISIVRGDARSYMIAAASIIAKVERDRRMIALDREYPEYGFARNKGYGTVEHVSALTRLGPCPEHRMSFVRKWLRA